MRQHVQLSEQIRPCETLACCWDVQQPANKPPTETISVAPRLKRPHWDWQTRVLTPLSPVGLLPGRVIPVTGSLVASLPSAWRYRVRVGTGWPDVSILGLAEIESWIYATSISGWQHVQLSVRIRPWETWTGWDREFDMQLLSQCGSKCCADPSLRDTTCCWDVKQLTTVSSTQVISVAPWFRRPHRDWQTLGSNPPFLCRAASRSSHTSDLKNWFSGGGQLARRLAL